MCVIISIAFNLPSGIPGISTSAWNWNDIRNCFIALETLQSLLFHDYHIYDMYNIMQFPKPHSSRHDTKSLLKHILSYMALKVVDYVHIAEITFK
jgi:hypothetical protein